MKVWESSEQSRRLIIRDDNNENLKACSRIVNKPRDKQAFKLVNLNSNNKQRTADRLKSATAFMSASSSSLVDSSHRFDSTSIEFKYAGKLLFSLFILFRIDFVWFIQWFLKGSCSREGADDISRNNSNTLNRSISSLLHFFIFYSTFVVVIFF